MGAPSAVWFWNCLSWDSCTFLINTYWYTHTHTHTVCICITTEVSAPPHRACDHLLKHLQNKVCGREGGKKKWSSRRQNEKGKGGGRASRDCWTVFTSFALPPLLCSVLLRPPQPQLLVLPSSSCHPQMNSMNSVSSSEDIKPPLGLQPLGNINYQCPSPGGMSKHICAICGDRSSGNVWGWAEG